MFQIPKCPYPTNHSFWEDKSLLFGFFTFFLPQLLWLLVSMAGVRNIIWTMDLTAPWRPRHSHVEGAHPKAGHFLSCAAIRIRPNLGRERPARGGGTEYRRITGGTQLSYLLYAKGLHMAPSL